MSRCMRARCISSPYRLGRAASKRSSPASIQLRRSSPTERALRQISCALSSNTKYRQRSPRRQAASAKWPAMVVLPVPATPESRMLEPRKKPPARSMASRPGTPLDTTSLDAGRSGRTR